jgi:hypothetical protein
MMLASKNKVREFLHKLVDRWVDEVITEDIGFLSEMLDKLRPKFEEFGKESYYGYD